MQRGRRGACRPDPRAAARAAVVAGPAVPGGRFRAASGALLPALQRGRGRGDDPGRPRLPHRDRRPRGARQPAHGWGPAGAAGGHLRVPCGRRPWHFRRRRLRRRGARGGDPRTVRDRGAGARPRLPGCERPRPAPVAALRGALGIRGQPSDRGDRRAGHLHPVGVAQPGSGAGGRGIAGGARGRWAGVHPGRGHHRPRRRASIPAPGTARGKADPDRCGGRAPAVRPRRQGGPRHRDLRASPARSRHGKLRRRPLRRLGRGAEPRLQPRLHRDRSDPVGHRNRGAGRQRAGSGALGRRGAARQRGRRRSPSRAARRRPQLGARDGAGRGHRQTGAVPGALPFPGRGAVPAPRPPQPGQLQQRELAPRRGRRRAPGPDHLRLHRRPLPGVAAARRRDRGRGARLRVPAGADAGADRAGPARADAAAQALDRHERPRLVLGRFARALPLGPGQPHRVAGRGPQRGQPAAVAVGQPVHQQRGIHRRRQRAPAGQQHRLREPGESAALSRPPDPVGAQGAGDAVVQRRARRGGAGWQPGRDHERLGRPHPRPGRPRHHPPSAVSQRRAGGPDRHRPRRRRRDDATGRVQSPGVLPLPQLRLPAAAWWAVPTR